MRQDTVQLRLGGDRADLPARADDHGPYTSGGGRGAFRMRRRFVHADHRRPSSVSDSDQSADQRRKIHLRRQHHAGR